jgi:hypothetical protein
LKIENSAVAKNREVLSLFNFRNSSRQFTQNSAIAGSIVAFVSLVGIMSVRGGLSETPAHGKIKHVLLISLDGLHALDLANFVKSNPESNLAQLSSRGVVYTQASTSKPSDSFPGLMSIVTGGSPISTGLWYEGAYARDLSPAGSDCKTSGTEIVWDSGIDRNKKQFDRQASFL